MESGSLSYGVRDFMYNFFEKPLSKAIRDEEVRSYLATIMSDSRVQEKILRFFWLKSHLEWLAYFMKGEKPKDYKRKKELADGGFLGYALFFESLKNERSVHVGLGKELYGNVLIVGNKIEGKDKEITTIQKVNQNYEGLADIIFRIGEEELNLNSHLLRQSATTLQ